VELDDVKIGKVIAQYYFEPQNNIIAQVFIKLRDSLFFHAAIINTDDKFVGMRSLHGYGKDQLENFYDKKTELVPLESIPPQRIRDSFKYIFEKNWL